MRFIKNLIIALSFSLLLWNCQSNDGSKNDRNLVDTPSEHLEANAITSFEQWLKNPQPLISAHRGGPYPGFPENAVETFQNVANKTAAIIECDISMTKDSILILMHDETLDRTTNGQGNVTDMMYDDIQKLFLVDNAGDSTSFRIPTLDETLAWGKGKVLFTLDVKRGVPFEKVIATIDKYDAASYAAIITYRIQDAKWVYSLNPDIMISVSAGDDGAISQIIESAIPTQNLLGFVGTSEPDRTHYEKLQKIGIKTILGTLGNLDKRAEAKGNDNVYLTYIENGANILATDRPIEVAQVLNTK
ncbi:MAG: glycerophosphodiester phosphodiesterase family protein [Bacteroidota bacterium]